MHDTTPSRVAIITGAAQGIGRAYALRFARDGYRVTIADLNAEKAASVVGEISAAGGTARFSVVDVSDEASCERAVAETVEAYGRLDVLVNNAAFFSTLERKKFWEISVEEWDRVMSVNMRGTWLMMKAARPAMKASGGGSIVNMSSSTVLLGRPGFLHYVGSKAGVIGLTRSAARELGDDNIRVNCILPGLTFTEVSRTSDEPGRMEQLLQSQTIKRPEVPDDLVGTAAFLAGPDSAFMTGQSLTVDGGNAFH
jgi:3-oxoacyl-[acyl-carrier protein] reductase